MEPSNRLGIYLKAYDSQNVIGTSLRLRLCIDDCKKCSHWQRHEISVLLEVAHTSKELLG